MAPKRRLQDPLPPAAAASSPSTEDEVEESDNDAVEEEANGVSAGMECEDEESEDDAEDESTESESESDKTQPSPSLSDFTIKPIMSKPISDSVKPKKNAANNNSAPVPATNISASGSKENNTEKEFKKKKVLDGQDEDVKKGFGVPRLWNEDDEIAILKGMINYHSKKGVDPCSEMAVFHEYMRNKIHADVSKIQLMSKIRSLKRKFLTNTKKGENGEDPVFSKPCDHEIFELSKKIWDSAAANGVDNRKPTQNKGKNPSALGSPELEVVQKKDEPNCEVNAVPANSCSNSSLLDGFLISGKLSLPESAMDIVKEVMPLIGSSKAKEMERRGKELQKDELLLFLKRVELIHDSAKLALDVMKSST